MLIYSQYARKFKRAAFCQRSIQFIIYKSHSSHVLIFRNYLFQVPCNETCKWRHDQTTRKQHVLTTCLNYKNTTSVEFTLTRKVLKNLNHLLVLDSHKLIYCYIPKVGCTNWKRILLVLQGICNDTGNIGQFQTHEMTAKHIKPLADYSIAEAKERLANYTKFVFVRHPLERILSVYLDKFQKDYPSSTAFRKNFGRKIATYGDHEVIPKRPDGTRNVTFAQFVRYVGDPQNSFSNVGPTEHWNDMYRMCQPCMIKYDIIGNFSTLHKDADFMLQAAGLNHKISYPKSTNPTNSSDEGYIESYFSNLPSADIQALLTRYAIDLNLYKFKIPSSLSVLYKAAKETNKYDGTML